MYLTPYDEKQLLESPTTRKLVSEILRLTQSVDILDAINDTELAANILKSRFKRGLAKHGARVLDAMQGP